jgi:hypothetical protein
VRELVTLKTKLRKNQELPIKIVTEVKVKAEVELEVEVKVSPKEFQK